MSFHTALSGLNAAQTDISVTSNNIANVGTLGFHGSRAEFADIYTTSPYSRPASQIGSGTEVSRIGVDFKQGSLTATGNVLDLSLQGPGFFQVRTGPDAGADAGYTRAGAFGMNREGFVTNAAGHFLTVFPTSENGDTLSTTQTQRLQIPQQFGTPQPTSSVDLSFNLSLSDNGGLGSQAAIPAAAFDPADPTTYAATTQIPVLDGAGRAVPAQAYFVMSDAPDALDGGLAYSVQLVVDGVTAAADPSATLSFDAGGAQTGGLEAMNFALGDQTLSLSLGGSRVSDDSFGAIAVSQNGTRQLDLSSVDVRQDGTVWASYGAETSIAVGQVAVANFSDIQGLGSIGSATYRASRESGEARLGVPGSSGFGAVRSGAVERSNVDLTEQLVNLIMAQRNYQASAKALETNGTLADTVLNIRS
ncbi:flagellar hook-basal body protein [Roseovarius mucosus DSM 17069]|uniref:Flagellar hook protein FlgE n=1 Tax=Roseovarius mucosus DSM 17069 TaxID=1288298 RepID=A0A0A0HP81_9RHOB|nr:flagellar hook protein FlgE [Roseovarius mucosus]KGM88374.1 flagellar hook-basal body protein [Roseovarius mucosus DSM 17069]